MNNGSANNALFRYGNLLFGRRVHRVRYYEIGAIRLHQKRYRGDKHHQDNGTELGAYFIARIKVTRTLCYIYRRRYFVH